jgi:predicted Abi (CAAX) family protease
VPLSGGLLSAGILALVLIAIGALLLGLRRESRQRQVVLPQSRRGPFNLVKLFVFPVLVEEIIFRVMLLPHPTEGVAIATWSAWAALSLGLYVLYYGLYHRLYHGLYNRRLAGVSPQTDGGLRDRSSLLMSAWIGLILILLYGLTGSLWAVTVVHWVAVVGWRYGFGGRQQFNRMQAHKT